MLSRKRECSQLMTEREFEEFWQNVDSRHRRLSPAKVLRRRAEEQARAEEVEATLDDDDVAPPANPQSSAAARSAKAARCAPRSPRGARKIQSSVAQFSPRSVAEYGSPAGNVDA